MEVNLQFVDLGLYQQNYIAFRNTKCEDSGKHYGVIDVLTSLPLKHQ